MFKTGCMKEEDILKAFEGRWRYKSTDFTDLDATLFQRVKDLCYDFFSAGVTLASRFAVHCDSVMQMEYPVTDREALSLVSDKTSFENWWNMYDKKIDRSKCEKKWAKLTDAERRACIAATPAYVASTPDIQFRRHPMTYLNNKSWENQIIPHNNGTNKPTIDEQRLNKLASILTE